MVKKKPALIRQRREGDEILQGGEEEDIDTHHRGG